MKVFGRTMKPHADEEEVKVLGQPNKPRKAALKNKAGLSKSATEETNHRMSDLSNSTDAEDDTYEEMNSMDEHSDDCDRFERQLRTKHSKACKAMAVRQRRAQLTPSPRYR